MPVLLLQKCIAVSIKVRLERRFFRLLKNLRQFVLLALSDMAYEHRIPVRWSDDEDQILRAEGNGQSHINRGRLLTSPIIVSRIGIKDWNRIAIALPGRSNKDCRKRWSKIGGHVNKGAWSPAEDYRLRKAVATVGIRYVNRCMVSKQTAPKNSHRWTTVASMMRTRHADRTLKGFHLVKGGS